MKKNYKKAIIAVMLLVSVILMPVEVLAVEGNMGFSGGISVEEPIEKTSIIILRCAF